MQDLKTRQQDRLKRAKNAVKRRENGDGPLGAEQDKTTPVDKTKETEKETKTKAERQKIAHPASAAPSGGTETPPPVGGAGEGTAKPWETK